MVRVAQSVSRYCTNRGIEFLTWNSPSAAKNFYLGWYAEFHKEFNPLEQPSKLFHLVGLSDYDEALASPDLSKYTIVLRIETFEDESLCTYSAIHECIFLLVLFILD